MSKPNNSLANIKLPGENTQRPIVPYAIGVSSSNNYQATIPNISSDQTIALLGVRNVFTEHNIFSKYIEVQDDGSDSQQTPRPENIYNWSDPDLFIYSTGFSLYTGGSDDYLQYNFPNRSGVLGLEIDIVDLTL